MSLFQLKYRFSARPWKYSGKSGWWFMSLPKDMSKEIRAGFKDLEEGWGRLSATAIIGGDEWKTAIWYDTKQETYFLPLKAEVRKKLGKGMETELEVEIRL